MALAEITHWRSRGILLFLFGAWISGTVFMAGVAGGNFDQVNAEKHPRLTEVFAKLPEAERAPALRFVASEMNRRYFSIWNYSELGLAAVALFVVLRLRFKREIGPWPLITVAVIAAITVHLALFMTPHIVDAGRAIEFIDRSLPAGTAAVSHFQTQHGLYMAIGLVKLLLTIGCSLALLLPRPR